MKRVAGAPSASAREMGARGAAFSRAQGRPPRRTCASSASTSTSPRSSTSPVPGGVIAETERGFGATAAQVAATAVPFAAGLQAGGVAATAKHFPGLGAARENTDFAVQRIGLSKAELREIDEAPYALSSRAGGELVMLAHRDLPGASPSARRLHPRRSPPASCARRLGFGGVSITDALDTVAVRGLRRPGEGGVAAARAGTDLLLFTDLPAAERAPGGPWSRSSRAARLDRPSSRPRPSGAATCAPSWRRTRASRRPRRRRRGSRPGRRRGPPSRPPSLAAYIAVSASETTDSRRSRGSLPNIATPTLAVTGSTRRRAGGPCSRIAVAIASATTRASSGCSGAGRPRTRRRRGGRGCRPRGCAGAAPRRSPRSARSPAGWPWVSLTRLKSSRSSISSAPVLRLATRRAPSPAADPPRSGGGSSARSAGPRWPRVAARCIRSLRLQSEDQRARAAPPRRCRPRRAAAAG